MCIRDRKYIMDILKRFNLSECKPVLTPGDSSLKLTASESIKEDDLKLPYQECVGALLYLSLATRPDITFQVAQASKFNSCYSEIHWKALKRILRYLKGTQDLGIIYRTSGDNLDLKGFCDADYASDALTRKSTTGYVVTINGSPTSWCSRLQQSVAQSTTEAEYVAIAECSKDIIWYQQLFAELNIKNEKPTTIFSDNQGAILLTKNSIFHKRTKHIDIRFHFIRELQNDGRIKVKYVPTKEQPADMLTKSLCSPSLAICKRLLNIIG